VPRPSDQPPKSSIDRDHPQLTDTAEATPTSSTRPSGRKSNRPVRRGRKVGAGEPGSGCADAIRRFALTRRRDGTSGSSPCASRSRRRTEFQESHRSSRPGGSTRRRRRRSARPVSRSQACDHRSLSRGEPGSR
jgi:hypothetical protein